MTIKSADNLKKDCFGREIITAKVCNVPKNKIVDFWKNSPLSHMLKFGEDNKNLVCMACGIPEKKLVTNNYGAFGGIKKENSIKWLDRAHIYPDLYGGSKKPNNLHLLCRKCHIESEPLEGYVYWLWIYLCSKLYKEGSMLEYDYDGGKTYHDDCKSIAKYESQAKIRYWYDRITEWDVHSEEKMPYSMSQPQAWTLINGSKFMPNTYYDIGEFKNIEFIPVVDECRQWAMISEEHKKLNTATMPLLQTLNFETHRIWRNKK